jgi:molecular chaperone DnaK (HSP70)
VLRLLNEPTAAALAYGFGRGLTQRVAVYDFGGGTFDISILEIGKDVFEVLSTCGDTYLGGDDFDDRLIDLLADEFAAKQGINLRNDPFALEKLKVAAEAAKKGLSVEEQVEIRIPDIVNGPDGQPRSIERTIGRAEYSSLVMDLVQRTFKVCDEALQQAKMVARDLGGVILVGGPTRLPVIRQAVGEYFQQEPRVDVDPDEVVAMGAAIHAASLCSTEQQDSFLLDVTPLSLRIGVAGGLAESVIERNTPVPIEQTRAFTTYQDFQESVKIRVFQGESRQADENEMLGQFEFSGFKKARRGEVRIDVTFEINSDGIVNVTARDQETGQQASTQITLSSGLSEDEIDQIIEEGRTDRMRSSVGEDGESPAPVAASTPLAPAGEEVSDELDLFPDADDSLDEVPELEVDHEDEATALVAGEQEEEADPNASTQPDLEPPAATSGPEATAEVEVDAVDPNATTAGDLPVVKTFPRDDGIAADDLDGSPDDEMEIQTGPESFFEEKGADLSQYGDDDSNRDEPER